MGLGVYWAHFHRESESNEIEKLFFSNTSSSEQRLAYSAAAAAADGDESRGDEMRSDAKSDSHLCV